LRSPADTRRRWHHWPARFKRFRSKASRLLEASFLGSGGSVNHLYSLINSQLVNPTRLANRASTHPIVTKYISRVMRLPLERYPVSFPFAVSGRSCLVPSSYFPAQN
jgi:hypothetical protein